MNEQVTDYTSANRSSLERTVEGAVRRLLGYGLAAKVRFTTSLRVGSGAATMAGIDGTDGSVMADGAVAGFLARDRANSTRYGEFYRNTTIRIFASETGDLWLIDPTTGAATLALANGAWTTVVAGVGYTNAWGDFGLQVGRYRKNILGNVEIQGWMKGGTLGVAAFTLPVGLRPPATVPVVALDATNTGVRIDVTSAGAVIPQNGNTGFIGFNATFSTI